MIATADGTIPKDEWLGQLETLVSYAGTEEGFINALVDTLPVHKLAIFQLQQVGRVISEATENRSSLLADIPSNKTFDPKTMDTVDGRMEGTIKRIMKP